MRKSSIYFEWIVIAMMIGVTIGAIDSERPPEEDMVPESWFRDIDEDDNSSFAFDSDQNSIDEAKAEIEKRALETETEKPDNEPVTLTANETGALNLLASANCGRKNGPKLGLIVGGTTASPHAWPWAIGLLRYGSFSCGGTILSDRYILTAAHCVRQYGQTTRASNLKVLVGAHQLRGSGQTFEVDRIIPHQQYDERFMQNDIALLRLRAPINFAQFGDKARPVCLPSASMDSRNFAGQLSTVVGWGTTREGGQIAQTLQQVQIPIIENSVCARKYNPMNIRSGQICAAYESGGRDSCQGDSGGSLTMPLDSDGKYYQLGVVSWGSGCARPGSPGVYTRVTKYLDWIARNAWY